jgi:hypothetical protein
MDGMQIAVRSVLAPGEALIQAGMLIFTFNSPVGSSAVVPAPTVDARGAPPPRVTMVHTRSRMNAFASDRV